MGNFRDYNKSLMFTFREGKANSGLLEKLRELADERDVSFNELIGSILSEYLKYLKPAKAKAKAPDYINEILDTFYEEYKLSRGVEYLNPYTGKDRSAIGKLLALYKDKRPNLDKAATKESLRVYFAFCMTITTDKWISENMSPTITISSINKISIIKKNGTTEVPQGATPTDIANILYNDNT